jgi:hypothetical protein
MLSKFPSTITLWGVFLSESVVVCLLRWMYDFIHYSVKYDALH